MYRVFEIIMINVVFWSAANIFGAALITSLIPESAWNHKRNIFKEAPFERRLYTLIKVSKWKDKLPVMDRRRDRYDRRHLEKGFDKDYLEGFIALTCKAESVHSGICIIGLASVTFVFFRKEPAFVFLMIYAIMFFIHLPFIIVQRYNRPRLLKLLAKQYKEIPVRGKTHTASYR